MTDIAWQEPHAHPRIDPQRRAWGILLLSFGFFGFICLFTGIGLSYFFFQSTLPLNTVLRVGRGTGVVSGQAVYGGETPLSNGAQLRTDPQTQVTVFSRDSLQNDRLVAAVTLRGDTTVTAWRMTRPRFEWSTGQYGIEFHDLVGQLDVFVPDNLVRDFRLTVITKQGDYVDLVSSGQYIVSASDSQVQVINRGGVAYLTPANTKQGHSIPPNVQGTIVYASNPSEVVTSDAVVNLLANSTFQDVYTPPDNGSTGDQAAVQKSWACFNSPDLPQGAYMLGMKDGRRIMHLLRGDNATTHGVTGCQSYFGHSGQAVSGYTSLSLRVTLNIASQSLNACGFQASECPLMVLLEYLDQKGAPQRWYHGFYALFDPLLNYPVQCNSCSNEHERLYPDSWYSFDSGNLFSLIAPDKRPESIIDVQFYASGHEYDVYVGEVALLAGNSNTP